MPILKIDRINFPVNWMKRFIILDKIDEIIDNVNNASSTPSSSSTKLLAWKESYDPLLVSDNTGNGYFVVKSIVIPGNTITKKGQKIHVKSICNLINELNTSHVLVRINQGVKTVDLSSNANFTASSGRDINIDCCFIRLNDETETSNTHTSGLTIGVIGTTEDKTFLQNEGYGDHIFDWTEDITIEIVGRNTTINDVSIYVYDWFVTLIDSSDVNLSPL